MVDVMAGGPNKYQKYERRGRKLYELVCLKDGTVMQFWDEGPHPVRPDGKPDPKWQQRQPTPSRQKLIAAILKRDPNDLPIFFARERGLKVWDVSYERFLDVPHETPEIKAAQSQYLGIRATAIAQGDVLAKGERSKQKNAAQGAA